MHTGNCRRVLLEPVEYNIIHKEIELYVSKWITIYAVKKHTKKVFILKRVRVSLENAVWSQIKNTILSFAIC